MTDTKMIKSDVALIDGKMLTYCQLLDKKDADKAGCPNGQFFYWEYNGAKIFTPFKIIQLIQQSVVNGNFEIEKMLTPGDMKQHYTNLIKAQQENVISHLNKLKQTYTENGIPAEGSKHIDEMINLYGSDMPYPDMDGVYRLSKEQAERHLGTKLSDHYDEKMIAEKFK